MLKSKMQKQKPPICRCCLAVNSKLVSIDEVDAANLYLIAVGVPLDPTDQFPQHVCVFCLRTMRRFARFRAHCHKVLDLMYQAQLGGKEITIEYTQSLTSKHQELKPQYTQTKTLILDLPGTGSKDEPNSIFLDIPDVKIESEVETEEKHENKDEVKVLLEPQEEAASDVVYVEEENGLVYKDEIEYLDDFDSFADDLDEMKNETKNNEMKVIEAEKFNKVTISVRHGSTLEDKLVNKRVTGARKNKKATLPVRHRSSLEYKSMNKRAMMDYTKSMGFELTELSLDEQIQEIKERKKEPGLVCELCGKRFNNSRSFERHKRYHVLKSKCLVCDLCSWVFKKKNRLIVHMLNHRYMLSCKSCGFKTKSNNVIKAHHEFHQGKLYPCKYCDKVFMKPTSLFGHTKTKHDTELPWCDLCGEGFNSEKGVKNHKKLTHNILDDYPYNCSCSKRFRSEAALDRHLKVEGCDLPSCAQCGESFPCDQLLKHHLVQRHIDGGVPATFDCSNCIFRFYTAAALLRHACGARAACAQCGDTFPAPQLLIDHVAGAHHIFRCEECSKQFTCKQFKIHYLRKHTDAARSRVVRRKRVPGEGQVKIRKWRQVGDGIVCDQPQPERDPAVETHMCEICGKGFKSASMLSLHKARHAPQPDFRCALCPKAFRMKAYLQSHMRVHTGERPYACARCPKAFKSAATYSRHYITVHSGQRNHVCSACDKRFPTSSCVKAHIRSVHMHMPGPARKRVYKKKLTHVNVN